MMRIYHELYEIGKKNEEIERLAQKLEGAIDTDDMDIKLACLLRGCTEKNGHLYDANGEQLDNGGLVDDEYYVRQYRGYCEDDFYGTVFYATEDNGVFVGVTFGM